MTTEEISEILKLHKAWIKGEKHGKKGQHVWGLPVLGLPVLGLPVLGLPVLGLHVRDRECAIYAYGMPG